MMNTKKEELKKMLNKLKDLNNEEYKKILKELCSEFDIINCSLENLVETLIKPAYSKKIDKIIEKLKFIVAVNELEDHNKKNNDQGMSL